MKIKEGYLLRKVADNQVVVPVGNLDFDGMINLNESGALLWKRLETECTVEDLIQCLTAEYGIGEDVAKRDVLAFLGTLRGAGLIDE